MMKLYVCRDSRSDTHFVVAEDDDKNRSRIVDWDLSEDEVAALVRKANSDTLTGEDGAEYCDDSITFPAPLVFEEDGSYDTEGGNRSRCSWVAGVRTIRDSFRYWDEAECPDDTM